MGVLDNVFYPFRIILILDIIVLLLGQILAISSGTIDEIKFYIIVWNLLSFSKKYLLS